MNSVQRNFRSSETLPPGYQYLYSTETLDKNGQIVYNDVYQRPSGKTVTLIWSARNHEHDVQPASTYRILMGTFEYDWIDYCLRWDGTSTPPSYMIEATYNGFDEDRMEIGYSEPGEEDAFVFHARIPVYNAWYNEMDFWKDEIDVDEVRMDDLVDRWRAIFR